MRLVLTWIGAVALLLFVVALAGFGYLVLQGNRLDNEGRIYADETVRPIVNHWDASALKDQASPALLAATKPEQFASLFRWFATLGSLKALEPCGGQSRIDITTQQRRVTTGQYSCQAHFQNGDAVVQLLLIRNQSAWRINGFHVTSPALLPREQAGKI